MMMIKALVLTVGVAWSASAWSNGFAGKWQGNAAGESLQLNLNTWIGLVVTGSICEKPKDCISLRGYIVGDTLHFSYSVPDKDYGIKANLNLKNDQLVGSFGIDNGSELTFNAKFRKVAED